MSEQSFRPLFPALAILLTPFDDSISDAEGALKEKTMDKEYWSPLLNLPGGALEAFKSEYLKRYPTRKPKDGGEMHADFQLIASFLNLLGCLRRHPPTRQEFYKRAEECRRITVQIANGER